MTNWNAIIVNRIAVQIVYCLIRSQSIDMCHARDLVKPPQPQASVKFTLIDSTSQSRNI